VRHLQTGVRRIAAAVVKEVADVMRLEYVDQPLILAGLSEYFFSFVARRTERSRWRVAQGANRGRRFLARVDQILGQCADDAVTPGVNLADFVLCLRQVSMTPQAEALMTAVTRRIGRKTHFGGLALGMGDSLTKSARITYLPSVIEDRTSWLTGKKPRWHCDRGPSMI